MVWSGITRWCTDALLYLVGVLNPNKDEGLSYKLHNIADTYAKRPTGDWRD